MSELVQTYWPLMIAALLIGLVIAWYLFHANRRTRVSGTSHDVLDEGSAPAERNRALIDAPPAAVLDTSPRAETPAPVPTPAPASSPPPVTEAVEPPTPVAEPATPTPPATTAADDLTRIKGVGPKLVALLADLGITSFAQVAAWSEGDIDRIDAQLGRFEGRIRRDSWVEQAKLLAADDTAGFAARFGNLN